MCLFDSALAKSRLSSLYILFIAYNARFQISIKKLRQTTIVSYVFEHVQSNSNLSSIIWFREILL